jgi:hypothetical protein
VIGAPGLDPVGFLRGAARLALFADSYTIGAMWFLAALGIVRIVAALAMRAGPAATIAIAAILLVLMFAALDHNWRHILQIHLLGVAFAAFTLGYAARDLCRRIEAQPVVCGALCLLALALTLATFDLNQGCRWDLASRCGIDFLNGKFGVSMIIGQFGNVPMFGLTAVLGCVFAACLAMLLARTGVVGRGLASLGRKSMDLLIVNAFFVALFTAPLSRWAAPHAPADNIVFFAGLMALTLALNLAAWGLFVRRLRRVRAFANRLATQMIDWAVAIFETAAVVSRGYRVSQEHD